MRLFRRIRIVLLLAILAAAALHSKVERLRSRAWVEPLEIIIYPINGENSARVDTYIDHLKPEHFADIDRFFQKESAKYNISAARPTRVRLGPELTEQPPASPSPDANFLRIALWGLRFRFWALRHTADEDKLPIRIFAHYHEAEEGKRLRHSLGLSKGLLGIVHAFAERRHNARNNIVIAHEVLHTVGATDKYDENGEPRFPAGYGDPGATPLLPQRRAEIMAGRIALSAADSRMPESLSECTVGELTAREINWVQEAE